MKSSRELAALVNQVAAILRAAQAAYIERYPEAEKGGVRDSDSAEFKQANFLQRAASRLALESVLATDPGSDDYETNDELLVLERLIQAQATVEDVQLLIKAAMNTVYEIDLVIGPPGLRAEVVFFLRPFHTQLSALEDSLKVAPSATYRQPPVMYGDSTSTFGKARRAWLARVRPASTSLGGTNPTGCRAQATRDWQGPKGPHQ